MEWQSDVSVGDWIRERVHETPFDTGSFVPGGFEAYARVFHPPHRERPVGRAWPDDDDRAGWEAFLADQPEVDAERVTWGETARAFGTTLHPLAQWHRIVRGPHPLEETQVGDPRDADGWRYDPPSEGDLDPQTLAALAGHLVPFTRTPDAAFAAVWEGWGDIVGAMTVGPGPTTVLARQVGDVRHARMLGASIVDRFNNPFRRRRWRSGILSDEISRGPRFSLPHRDHVLFRSTVRAWQDPSWPERVPWRRPEGRGDAQSPSLIWPEGREWVLATEVDLDSTIVAGPSALIRAICTDPAIEALPVRENPDLTWDADEVNRQA